MALVCIECQAESPKYKCSTCYSLYCSPGCWKTHKGSAECKRPGNVSFGSSTIERRSYETEDTIDPEKLNRLGSNNELKRLLLDPLLQKLLKGVDISIDPYDSVQDAMQDSAFVQFVDICLKTVEEPEP